MIFLLGEEAAGSPPCICLSGKPSGPRRRGSLTLTKQGRHPVKPRVAKCHERQCLTLRLKQPLDQSALLKPCKPANGRLQRCGGSNTGAHDGHQPLLAARNIEIEQQVPCRLAEQLATQRLVALAPFPVEPLRHLQQARRAGHACGFVQRCECRASAATSSCAAANNAAELLDSLPDIAGSPNQ